MPYIHIKGHAKDAATKRRLAEAILADAVSIWGCPPEAVYIRIDDFSPREWEQKVLWEQILPEKDRCILFAGKRTEPGS